MVDKHDDSDSKLSRLADDYLSQSDNVRGKEVHELAADHEAFGHVIRDIFPILSLLKETTHDQPEAPQDASLEQILHHTALVEDDFRLSDFVLIRKLGRGGMGIVYEAEQISLDRRVALKILPNAALLNERQLIRFRNEARTVAMLHHPNIVAIHSVGTERGVHFFAMQMIDGVNLSALIGSSTSPNDESADQANAITEPPEIAGLCEWIRSPLDSQERWDGITRLAIQAASAIEYAHRQGVLHRDIKPANLLIDRTGRLYVTDFGLARIQTDAGLTCTGDILGTLRYIPPERICGDQTIDPRSDIYSLGVTLYEMATLQPAYATSSTQERLAIDILHSRPTAPSRLRPGIPRDLETIILKAMAKESSDRYGSMRDLRLDLESFGDGRPIQARPSSVWHHLKSWCRRRPAVATLTGTVLLLLAILAIGGPLAAWRQQNLTQAVRRKLLHADLMLAYQAWYQGNAERAAQLLAKHPVELNDKPLRFVQQLLETRIHQADATIIDRHREGITPIAVSSDGTVVASADESGVVRIVEISTGRKLREWKAADRVTSVAFGPTEDQIVSGGAPKHLQLWNWRTGRSVRSYEEVEFDVTKISMAPSGSSIAVGFKNGVVGVWSVDGKRNWVRQAHSGDIWGLAYSPDGETLTTTNELDAEVKSWESRTGESTGPGVKLKHLATGVAYIPTDGTLVTYSPLGVQFWDREKRQELMGLSYSTTPISSVAASPTGLLATGGWDNQVFVWDYPSRWRLEIFLGNRESIESLAFTPDDRYLLSSSRDGMVRRFDLRAALEMRKLSEHLDLNREVKIALSPDGTHALSVSANFEAPSLRTQEGTLALWNLREASVDQSRSVPCETCAALAWAPRLGLAALAGPSGVQFRTYDDRNLLYDLDPRRTHSVEFSPDDRWLVTLSGSDEGALRIWRLDTLQPGSSFPVSATLFKEWTYHNTNVRTDLIAFHEDSRGFDIGVRTPDGTQLCRWKFHDSEWIETDRCPLPNRNNINCVRTSPDTRHVYVASQQGLILRFSFEQKAIEWQAHASSQNLFSACLSHDGRVLLTGSDRSIQFWSADTGDQLATMPVSMWVTSIELTPDERTLLWGGGDGIVRFLPTTATAE